MLLPELDQLVVERSTNSVREAVDLDGWFDSMVPTGGGPDPRSSASITCLRTPSRAACDPGPSCTSTAGENSDLGKGCVSDAGRLKGLRLVDDDLVPERWCVPESSSVPPCVGERLLAVVVEPDLPVLPTTSVLSEHREELRIESIARRRSDVRAALVANSWHSRDSNRARFA